MKRTIKSITKYFGLGIVLTATLCGTAGCGTWLINSGSGTRSQTADPLAGWKPDFNPRPDDQVIEKDYKDYIKQLNAKGYVGPVQFFEDGTGRHAVKFEVFDKRKNASWNYAIIYNKDNKRVNVIKYGYSRYTM